MMSSNNEIKQYFHKKYFNKFCENDTTLYTKEQGRITLPADDIHIDIVKEKVANPEDAKLVRISIWLDYIESAFLDFTDLKPLTSQGINIRLYGYCKKTCVKLGSRVNIEVDSELQKSGRLYIAKEDEDVDSTMIITQLEFNGDDVDHSRTEYISIDEYNQDFEKRRKKYRKKLNIPVLSLSIVAIITVIFALLFWTLFSIHQKQQIKEKEYENKVHENEVLLKRIDQLEKKK